MKQKSTDTARGPEHAATDTGTASYEQLQGAPNPRPRLDGRNERAPHERDESASGTGNRLDESPPAPSSRQISQAHGDIEHGLVDTDRRGIPDDTPGSERNRES